MIRALIVLLGLTCLCSCATRNTSQPSSHSQAQTNDNPESRLWVKGKIGGKEARLALDTGCGTPVALFRSGADRMGLKIKPMGTLFARQPVWRTKVVWCVCRVGPPGDFPIPWPACRWWNVRLFLKRILTAALAGQPFENEFLN